MEYPAWRWISWTRNPQCGPSSGASSRIRNGVDLGSDAPFSLEKVLDRSLDAEPIIEALGRDPRLTEALERYKAVHIHVGDQTNIRIDHSTVHGPVAGTISGSFNQPEIPPEPDE